MAAVSEAFTGAKVTHSAAGKLSCRGKMPLMLVSLLCCVTAARACLQCDRSIRMMHEDFILSAPTLQDQLDLQSICDQAYVTYIETSQERKGVIGEIRKLLYRSSSLKYKCKAVKMIKINQIAPFVCFLLRSHYSIQSQN